VTQAADPITVLRSRGYIALLVLAAAIGVPISAAAYGFLVLVNHLQQWLYTDWPNALGLNPVPWWWPLPFLVLAGILVAAAVRYLPGTGGHIPADGLKTGDGATPMELPGIALAALASLGLGVVLGPEAPLIALGGGLATLAIHRRAQADHRLAMVVGAAGTFAAISTLLGSPLLGAFLLMEASGLGGATLGMVLVPGLLASGVGALIFVGLDHWTGWGSQSLQVFDLPTLGPPTVAEFGWALVIGACIALLAAPLRVGARWVARLVQPRLLVAAPVMGLLVGLLAAAYTGITGHPPTDVLFSGQNALPGLLDHRPAAGVLVTLVAAKGLAYLLCLGTFRGGPIFPSMYLGAAFGLALSFLPGLPTLAGAAMGIGAMVVAMLRLPLTSVLLASLLFGANGLTVMPVVIVAVVVSHVASAHLQPPPKG
jgi:H+/Cl- antiporter ClcA